MSFKRVLLLFAVCFLAQLSVVNLITFRNLGPDLIMCMMIAITYLYDDGYRSIPFALVFGLLLDVCAHQYIGITPLIYLLVGIIATAARIWLNAEKLVTMAVTGAVCTVVFQTLYAIVMKILGDPAGVLYIIEKEPIFIMYNVLVLSVMFGLMHTKAEEYHNDRYNI